MAIAGYEKEEVNLGSTAREPNVEDLIRTLASQAISAEKEPYEAEAVAAANDFYYYDDLDLNKGPSDLRAENEVRQEIAAERLAEAQDTADHYDMLRNLLEQDDADLINWFAQS